MRGLEELVASMREKCLTFEDLVAALGKSPIYLAAVLQGQQRLDPPEAEKPASALGRAPRTVATVTAFPVRSARSTSRWTSKKSQARRGKRG